MPYEGMFVVYNKEAQKTHDYLEQHIRDVLTKVGATVVRLSKWDERQLAYEIKGQRDGIFYLCYFDSEGGKLADLRREAELSEIILRLLVLQLDEVPSEEEVLKRSGRSRKESEEAETPAAAAPAAPAEAAAPASEAAAPAAGAAAPAAEAAAPAAEAAAPAAEAAAPAAEATETKGEA